MTPRAAKAKGNRLENWICDQLAEYGIDQNARREIGSGSGNKKGDIYSSIDLLIEAKNQKSVAWWQAIDQAKEQAKQGFHNPDKWALIVRDPREKEFDAVYAVIDFHELMSLYKKAMAPKMEQPDRSMAYDLRNLSRLANKVAKQLEK